MPAALSGFPAGGAIGAVASVLFYLAIPVATQYPHLFFFDRALSAYEDAKDVASSHASFAARSLLFWLFVLGSLGILVVYGNSDFRWEKALSRWVLLVTLVVIFSATDYGIPSYARYLRLKASGNWGPRARVMRGP